MFNSDGDPHSDSTLEQRKLAAEVEKLEQETKLLRNPLARPASWIPVVVAAGSLVSLWVQWTTSALREQQLALKAAQELSQAKDEVARIETRLKNYKVDFLKSVVKNLSDTKAAVSAYSADNWQQVIVLRDGNRATEELLTLMLRVGLLPPSLNDDLQALQNHYQEWSREYDRRFTDGVPRPHRQLVFVGTFPGLSEESIKRCLADLEANQSECTY